MRHLSKLLAACAVATLVAIVIAPVRPGSRGLASAEKTSPGAFYKFKVSHPPDPCPPVPPPPVVAPISVQPTFKISQMPGGNDYEPERALPNVVGGGSSDCCGEFTGQYSGPA